MSVKKIKPISVICGESHSIYLSRKIGMTPQKGWRIFVSGLNDDGQLGLNHFDPIFTPEVVSCVPPFTQVSSKGDFTLALDIHNNIWGWGSNSSAIFGSFTEDLALPKPIKLSTTRFKAWGSLYSMH